MRAAVGVAHHNGWAHLVTLGLEGGEPQLIDRRRVALIGEGLPAMPHEHEAQKLPLAEGEALIARVRASIDTHARLALETLRADLAPVHDLTVAAIRRSSFGALPPLAEVMDYKPMIYAADGMMYAEAVERAAEAAGLTIFPHAKNAEFDLAAAALRTDAPEAQAIVKALAKGPPWTAEHQRAAAAALAALNTGTRP